MSLETTYRILAATHHREVVGVLGRGADSNDPIARRLCFKTLAYRNDEASHDALIQLWSNHRDSIIKAISVDQTNQSTENFSQESIPFVRTLLERIAQIDVRGTAEGQINRQDSIDNDSFCDSLHGDEAMVRVGLDIVTAFSIYDSLPSLIRLATEHASHVVREMCVEAVLTLAQSWGRHARRNYAGQRTCHNTERNRLAVTALLHDAVTQFQSHRQEGLLDAWLMLVTWNDPCLRSAFDNDTPCRKLILRRLKSSRRQNVMELLAGYLCRRTIPSCVLSLLLQRRDPTYRETLLEVISTAPGPTTLSNLKEYGLPDCLRGGVETLRDLGTDRDAAFANAYSMAMQNDPETIAVLLDVIDRHSRAGASSPMQLDSIDGKTDDELLICITSTLTRCEVPGIDYWIGAFESPVIEGADVHEMTQGDSITDRAAKICRRLIDLSQVDEPALSKAASRLLGELTIQNAISLFPEIPAENRLRLGRTLMQIDPSTLDVVKDGLRHAVMQRRLEAIEFAQTLGLVDLMIEPFSTIARNDHQTVRIAAADALGSAIGEASHDLLRELTCSPQGSVRDAAKASMESRKLSV